MLKRMKTRLLTFSVVFIGAMTSVGIVANAEEPAGSTGTEQTVTETTEATTQPVVVKKKKIKKKKVKLGKAKITEAIAYENGKISITWNKLKKANYYCIFRKTPGKPYKIVARTKKTTYIDKKCKAGTRYTYRIQGVKKKTKKTYTSYSGKSYPVSKLSRSTPDRIAFIGDSVMSGFSVYGVANHANERSFAKVSMFVQHMKNDIGSINAYDPDRVYIMCGTNNCVGNQSDAYLDGSVAEYKEFINMLISHNSDIEIVVMAVGNTRSSRVPNSTVNRFNSKLEDMVEGRENVKFFDTGSVINDGSGSLSSGYAAGDGIHWNAAAYRAVYDELDDFVEEW